VSLEQGDALEAERLEAEKRLEAEREIEKAFASYFGEGQKNSTVPQLVLNGGMFTQLKSPNITNTSTASTQNHNGYAQPQYAGQAIPQPPDQSAPTSVLYEKARQAAVAKTAPNTTKRPGLPSQRRPWSQEEENALMAGLDLVKGPHWSNILALYGPDGSVNTVLRERNQVQLKDKARNLKLFFLKSNIEVPHYLRAVTGELRTRAPSQAAKKEAEQRELLESAEEQERIGGIFALNSIKAREAVSDAGEEEAGEEEEERLVVEAPEKLDGMGNEHSSADETLRQRLSAHNSEATQA
jgi:glutaredoxin